MKTHLPTSKIPTVFQIRSKLLRLPSGKIDFRGLENLPIETTKAKSSSPQPSSTPIENDLLTFFQQVLNDQELGVDDDFLSFGLDSLGVMQVCALASTVGITFPMSYVYRYRTVSSLAIALQERNKVTQDGRVSEDGQSLRLSASWLREDIAPLAETIRASFTSSSESDNKQHRIAQGLPNTVLLTGATGFHGCRILVELLQSTELAVICLIRGASNANARERLRDHLKEQSIQLSVKEWDRIQILAGDVTTVQFALAEQDYRSLVDRTKIVMHCAADTNSISNYYELRRPNVEGLGSVLVFLRDCRQAKLFYASTLSVFAGSDQFAGEHFETDEMSNGWLIGGYAQSKWAAEELLRSCGIPRSRAAILRFGLLTGDTESGVTASHDVLSMLIRGIAGLGCVPVLPPDVCFDMTPVNIAAKISAMIVRYDPMDLNPQGVWHIGNVATISSEVLFQFLRRKGIPLTSVSWEDFRKKIRERSESPLGGMAQLSEKMFEAAACLAMMRWCSETVDTDAYRPLDLFQATRARFDTTMTSELLKAMGQAPFPCTEEVLLKSLGPHVESLRTCIEEKSLDFQ